MILQAWNLRNFLPRPSGRRERERKPKPLTLPAPLCSPTRHLGGSAQWGGWSKGADEVALGSGLWSKGVYGVWGLHCMACC